MPDSLKLASQIVLSKLKECPLLCGKYDPRDDGGENYMYGILTVMEIIANYAGDEEFEDVFLSNMVESEDKVK